MTVKMSEETQGFIVGAGLAALTVLLFYWLSGGFELRVTEGERAQCAVECVKEGSYLTVPYVHDGMVYCACREGQRDPKLGGREGKSGDD